MLNTNDISLSSSMQMYLVKIKRMSAKTEPVPLSLLADSLNISPVSVNEMCRKLDEMALIHYEPYKGASLTSEGDALASRVLRWHRIWEVFLVDKLNLSYKEAHRMADTLEHATNTELANRLEEFLGYPQYTSEGKPIPERGETITSVQTIPLSEVAVGSQATFQRESPEPALADFFKQSGIQNGTTINVLARSKDVTLLEANGKTFQLSTSIAERVKMIEQIPKRSTTEENTKTKARNDGEKKKFEKEKAMKKDLVKTSSLKDLPIGGQAVIVSVKGSGAVKQRMMDMGLVPGSRVKVVRVAPLGDPIEISIKGYHLTLRKNEAKNIFIELTREN